MTYETKDSGKREQYASGMRRDTEQGKARFDLILPKGVPYSEQMLTRFAELMARGADKYGDRNWELARGQEELERYYSSALRHLQQWVNGETDEDHAAAVMFNVMAGETVKYRMREADKTELFAWADKVVARPCPPECPVCIANAKAAVANGPRPATWRDLAELRYSDPDAGPGDRDIC